MRTRRIDTCGVHWSVLLEYEKARAEAEWDGYRLFGILPATHFTGTWATVVQDDE